MFGILRRLRGTLWNAVANGAAGYLPGNGLLPAFGLAYLAADDLARVLAG